MWSKSQLRILYEEALPFVLLMEDGRLGMTNNTITTAQFSELENTFCIHFLLLFCQIIIVTHRSSLYTGTITLTFNVYKLYNQGLA